MILIIGILAAIAIPSFLNQKSKATDASAKELARTAQTAAETYSTDHNGLYTGMNIAALQTVEPSIPSSDSGSNAFLSAVGLRRTTTVANDGYTVTTTSPSGNTFTISRAVATGVVSSHLHRDDRRLRRRYLVDASRILYTSHDWIGAGRENGPPRVFALMRPRSATDMKAMRPSATQT